MRAFLRIDLTFSAFVVLALLVVLDLVGSSAAQGSKHQPDFTLTISTEGVSLAPHKDGRKVVSVVVVEKNISNHAINIGRLSSPDGWYRMTVLREGKPVSFTDDYKRARKREQYDAHAPVEASPIALTLKPSEHQTFDVLLSEIYDLSVPGRYQITFSRGTDSGQPDNVEVRSNTLIFQVPEVH